MNLKDYLSVTPEIQEAIDAASPSSHWNPPF